MSAISLDLQAAPTAPISGQAMELPTFLRLFQLRATQIMWFLGAGASRASGIKTAGDMIWEFKQKLYCSEKKVPLSYIADPGDIVVQRRMQAHFDVQSKFPPLGAEDEYSAYFDATYPSAKDRRAYIDSQVKLGKPSYGHFALALLMREGLCHAVWTTNFDHTVEDATFKILGGSGRLVVADLGEPRKLIQAWSEARWPVYGKLHGDYHSEKLKNTGAELRKQDDEMRQGLVDACRGRGLAVVGYSGRDASVMKALAEAIDNGRGYPGGLFWFKRFGETPYPAVTELVQRASSAGIEAHLIDVETFDELLSDVVRFLPNTTQAAQSIQDAARPFDLHDYLKAIAASERMCIQIVREVGALDYPCRCSVMWRLGIALYTKAGGVPWVLADMMPGTAFIGIDYALRSATGADTTDTRFAICCSQVFDAEGSGFEFVAYEADVKLFGKNPFLRRDQMMKLISRSLQIYQRKHIGDPPPSRVVVHKNTEFKPHEVDGCFDALLNVPDVELIHVQQDCGWKGVQIDAPQKPRGYPLHRGTCFQLGPYETLLWTQGNLPQMTDNGRDYFKEGKGIPDPLMLVRYAGLGSVDDLCRETLALTKMDWNNDGPYDRLPVTLSFAQILAKVVKRMPALEPRSYAFRHFM